MIRNFYHSLKSKLSDSLLLIELARKRRAAWREFRKTHTPIKWRTQLALVADDLDAHFRDAEENKRNALDLLSKLYANAKDIQEKAQVQAALSLLAFAYIAAYVFALQLPISISGITLQRDPTVLAVLMVVSSFFGFRTAQNNGHANILKASMNSIIDGCFDPKMQGVLKSAYLHKDDTVRYTSKTNPDMHLQRPFTYILIFGLSTAAIAMAILAVAMVCVEIKAGFLLYNTDSPHYYFHMMLLGVAVALGAAALCLTIMALTPLRYRDWAKSTRLEMLRQSDPEQANQLSEEMYGDVARVGNDINEVRRRLLGR